MIFSLHLFPTPIIPCPTSNFTASALQTPAAGVENGTARMLIDDAMSAVTKAVAVTNQTYVDALKRRGKFSTEKQREAFQRF